MSKEATTIFKVNKTYSMRSACDHNCIWNATVLKRTAQFVTLKVDREKEPVRCKVRIHNNTEVCSPLGNYSMSPVLAAE